MHTALTEKYIELYDKYVMKTYPKADILFTRGEGCRLWDGDGREYLDFAALVAERMRGVDFNSVLDLFNNFEDIRNCEDLIA